MLSWLEPVSRIVAIFGALIAAGWALLQARMSLDQRRRDLRWRQAEMAKKVIDEWFDRSRSRVALDMTEGRKRHYPVSATLGEVITQPVILGALAREVRNNEHPDLFIQDCFDDLFYLWDRTEQFLVSGLIRFEDVERPTSYYVERMAEYKEVYGRYAAVIGNTGALAFLNRFPVWRAATPELKNLDRMRITE